MLRHLAVLAVLAMAGRLAAQVGDEKHAVMIAVRAYEDADFNKPQLQFPEDDARAIGALLEKSGYKVEYLLGRQASKAAIEKKLSEAAGWGGGGGVAVIALFGHGVEYAKTKEGFFCPYDAARQPLKDAQERALNGPNGEPLYEPNIATLVSIKDLMLALGRTKATNRLLIADCCREQPNQARGGVFTGATGRALGESLTVAQMPDGAAALFACSAGEQAFESATWRHGAMTNCLLEALPGLGADAGAGTLAERLKPAVRKLVAAETGGRKQQTVHYMAKGIVDLKLAAFELGRPPASPSSPSKSAMPVAKPSAEMPLGKPDGDLPAIIAAAEGIALVRIKAGSFVMGSPAAEAEREVWEIPHDATLARDFLLGKTEVTQAQYQKLMGANPSLAPGAKLPVENVTWLDAAKFCNALSAAEKLPAYYRIDADAVEIPDPAARGYRLPTETEWEYACRGGTTSRFHWGDALEPRRANANHSTGRTTNVGSHPANAFGLHDMHGNVWEWCWDWYGPYPEPAAQDPQGPASGPGRIIRGGGWASPSRHVRSANRMFSAPTTRNGYTGFRVARFP